MGRPRIGITSWRRDVPVDGVSQHNDTFPVAYVRAVARAGGLPLLLPVIDADYALELLDALDGIVFTAGGTVEPALFGGSPAPDPDDVDPQRDAMEIELWREIASRGTPALGICRGTQSLNVAFGGSLHQHVDGHMESGRAKEEVHRVSVTSGSRLSRLAREPEFAVNSLHVEAPAEIGAGLRAVATAPDGVIEALELEDADHVLGVQWHPELRRHKPEHLAFFIDLVERAS